MDLKNINLKRLDTFISKNAVELLAEVREMEHGTVTIPFVSPPTQNPQDGTWLGYVRLWDLPINLSTEANARNSVVKGPISREIRDTFLEEGEKASKRNKGLVIIASRVTTDPSDPTGKRLFLDFKKGETGLGVTDGGTSYGNFRIIRRVVEMVNEVLADNSEASAEDRKIAIQAMESLQRAVVAVEIFSSLPQEERQDVSYCRNRANKQHLKSMLHLRGHLDTLERALGSFGDRVVFHEQQAPLPGGPQRHTPVEEVIKLVTLFSNQKREVFGTQIYGGSFLQQFKDKHDTEPYLNAIENIQQICLLYERVYKMFCGRTRKDGSRRVGVEDGEITLGYTGTTVKYFIPAAYVHPVVGALRLLLQDGKWVVNPEKFLKKHGHELIDAVDAAMNYVKRNDKTKVNTTAFGRSEPVWAKTLEAMAFAMADEGVRPQDAEARVHHDDAEELTVAVNA